MNWFRDFLEKPVPTLNVLELQKRLRASDQPILLDVRQPEEFRSGHIAGSKLIPLGQLRKRLHELPKGQEIVCICASGNRSVNAVHILVETGYTARSLNNSMIAWQMARLPIKKGMSS